MRSIARAAAAFLSSLAVVAQQRIELEEGGEPRVRALVRERLGDLGRVARRRAQDRQTVVRGVAAHARRRVLQQQRARVDPSTRGQRDGPCLFKQIDPLGERAPIRGGVLAQAVVDIGELVERTRELGVPVTLDVRGTPDAEHRAVEMSAYRVIQEALTNVIKHAGETRRVEVTVAHRRDGLDVEVADDGRGLAQPTSSDLPSGQHGLLGMRERVEVWGGTLDAGPRPGGGFTVRATFPYEPAFAVEA